jgi:hypothetical protein
MGNVDGDEVIWPAMVRDGAGEPVYDPRCWTERAEERLAALERRLAALETGKREPGGQPIVLLRWVDGQIVPLRSTVMHIKPDVVHQAVKLLKQRSAVWVRPADVDEVLRLVNE